MSQQLFIPAGVRARYNVKVPVRDGTKLSADIFLPKGEEGPFPTILASPDASGRGSVQPSKILHFVQNDILAQRCMVEATI